MARRPHTRHVPRDSSRRRGWIYFAIAAFIALDLLLVAWALSTTRADPTGAPLPSVEPTSPAEPAVASEPEPVVVAEPGTTAVPPARILTAVDGTTAWRATTGACPASPARPERTTDSGETWVTTDATGPTGVTALLRIMVDGPQTASMVGLSGTDCTPQLIKTFVAGRNYVSYPEQLAGAWFVDPANRAEIHSPDGKSRAPCDAIIALAPSDAENAAILCSDNEIFMTTDAAATWSEPTVVPGALNLTSTGAGYVTVVVGSARCAGLQLLALSEEEVTATGCYPMTLQANSLAGNVALAVSHNTVWLWAGEALGRSTDGGATWL
ncbi:MAG: hypothetical protein JWL94_1927 [Microbacteriaceae bacterium]|nr:hypothetical protein [Microbacteriaceae bacterium]